MLRRDRCAERVISGQRVDRPFSKSSGTSIQPSRQPVIPQYFEKELITIAVRLVLPGTAAHRFAAGDAVIDLIADQPYGV